MSEERKASDILRLEDELLRSFVRIDLDEEEGDDYRKDKLKSSRRSKDVGPMFYDNKKKRGKPTGKNESGGGGGEAVKKRNPREFYDVVYTDKDRAAAVSIGMFDIKESLVLKRKKDRNDGVLVSDETDASGLVCVGLKEMKSGNFENALQNLSKALELNGSDVNALVARSRCYLHLGEAAKALQDAETAIAADKNNIRAIYQKAESLYFLGLFEQSLMFFHRGLQLRPDSSFRLGVQKTREAIENTVGAAPKKGNVSKKKKRSVSSSRTQGSDTSKQTIPTSIKPHRPKTSKVDREKRNARQLLGELCVDKEYLENLLKHPDLKRADTNTENISVYAKEAVDFLNKRQEEFWRQRRPCTALLNQKSLPPDAFLSWF